MYKGGIAQGKLAFSWIVIAGVTSLTACGGGSSEVSANSPNVALELASLTLAQSTVNAGTTSMGTVTLNAPAPLTGAIVTLSSSDSSVAEVPSSIGIASGNTTTTFVITTPANASTATLKISATYNATKVAQLTVNAAFSDNWDNT